MDGDPLSTDDAYRLMAEHTVDVAVVTLDRDCVISTWSAGAEGLFGYPQEEIVGKNAAILFPADAHREAQLDSVVLASRASGSSKCDTWFVRRDGSRVWVSGITLAATHADGSLRGFVMMLRDRSDLKAAQDGLQREQQRHLALFREAPAAIAIIRGPTHIYELANPRYQQIVGRRESELLGRPGREALPELSAQGVWDIFDDIYATGESFIGNEFPVQLDRLGTGELEQCYFNFVAQSTRDMDGQVDGVLIHAVEITDQVASRHRVEELAIELAAARARFEFGQRAGEIGTFEWDLNSGYIFWSAELETLYGLQPGEFGHTYAGWKMRLHPDDATATDAAVTTAAAEGTELDMEFRIIRGDGTVAWLAAKGAVLPDETGNPARMIGVNINITARKQIESNLHFLSDAGRLLASSLDYEVTLEAVAQLAVPHIGDWCSVDVLDDQGLPQQVAVAHKDPEKVAWARGLRAATPPNMEDTTGLPGVLRSGQSVLYPYISDDMLVEASGNEKQLELSRSLGLTSAIIVPLHAGGKTVGAITFVTTESRRRYTDTDLVMAEELAARASLAIENARLYRDARDAVSLRDEFISMASHELKTPVTSLKIYAQIMGRQAQKRGDEGQTTQLLKMEAQVDKLGNLINDLLDISRIRAGKLEYRSGEFDLAVLVRDIAESPKTVDQQHHISVNAPDTLLVTGDAERIGQIVTNLLTNAIKYSPGADQVLVSVESADGNAVVTVRDFGIGIPAEHQEHIFDRFYQVSTPDARTFAGLGMGLYISREIALRHGGDILVESHHGEGSVFSLVLPLNCSVLATER